MLVKHHTISSLQIGQSSFELAAATDEGPPFCKETTELKSWLISGSGDVAKGEADDPADETILSAGEVKSEIRCAGGAGGAKDFPLPNILPPPSFRPDIAEDYQMRILRAWPARGV